MELILSRPKKHYVSAIYCAILFIFFFFIFSSSCLATDDVVINEILPNPAGDDPEWVEFYNKGNQVVDLTGWYLEDKANHKKTIESLGEIGIGKIKVLDGGEDGWLLNNGSETVYLKDSDGNIRDSYNYSSDPGENKSIGREEDGADNWIVFDMPTKGESNKRSTESPSPSPSPSPSLSPSPSAEISTATYKINEVKDKNNNVVSSVKIYINNVYTHHYAPETFEFCQDCKCGSGCDENIDLNFSQYTISLIKDGYEKWEETKTISAGNTYEVNPVMDLIESSPQPSPSPSPSPVLLSPSPSSFLSPSPSVEIEAEEASFSGEVFGASASGQQENQATRSAEQEEKNKKHLSLPLMISLTGLLFLAASAFPWIKKFIKSRHRLIAD